MAELPELDKHCTQCNSLDFLPIECSSCKKIFCKLHSSREKHCCDAPEVELPSFTGVKSFKCCLENCDKSELTPVVCEHCKGNYCLEHRHQIDHKCSALETAKEYMPKTKEHVQQILEKKATVPSNKITKSKKPKTTAAKVALMKIKMKASGSSSIPQDDRIYAKIILPLGSRQQYKEVFFSSTWTIGRTVDYLSNLCGVENRNNEANAKKLKLFDSDEGKVIEFQLVVEDCIKEELFISGSTLILEYIDNDEKTVDLTKYQL